MNAAEVQRIAAFSDGAQGGNPAGVWIGAALPPEADMQRVAQHIGYSETAFAAPLDDGWRVRYFSPEAEVPFCGHATIALGAALAAGHGEGIYALALNEARITVEGHRAVGADGTPLVSAALQSPPTHSSAAPAPVVARALALFGYRQQDLDPRIPPALGPRRRVAPGAGAA